MQHVAHWDDVAGFRLEAGHIAGTWFDVGSAAGSVGAGVKRIQVDPGRWSSPAHVEGAEEEIFYVLGGSGLSWQDDGRGGAAYEVRPGDCLVHRAAAEAHTLCAGPDGLDVLAFGQRFPHGITVLTRAAIAWMSSAHVEVVPIGEEHPFKREAEREAAVGEPEVGELMERPSTIVNVAAVREVEREHGRSHFLERDFGRTAGSSNTGMSWVRLPPGKLGWPPHCHSAEEEIFVVLEGAGTLVLGAEEYALRPGHVVARPPGTGIAHSFGAGAAGLTYLAYGTREPNDIAYFPRSNKVWFRGVGVIGRLEPLEYWEGEPQE